MKIYAQKKHSSVSQLVEDYFEQLTKPVEKESILDFLKDIESADFPEDYNYKEEYYKRLKKKHES